MTTHTLDTRHTLSCEINTQVSGDHAYCECECHMEALPAVQLSRKRKPKYVVKMSYNSSLYDVGEIKIGLWKMGASVPDTRKEAR